MELKLGNRVLDLSVPRVMGVLNVTPDSFSDGGDFMRRDRALLHAVAMQASGADIIDVGGESTRPGASDVSVQQELDRVIPVIEAIVSETGAIVSIDTSKPEVMRAAVSAGASIINDVFALRREGAVDAAADLDAAVCLMHMQGTPGTMQDEPEYRELPGDVIQFLAARVDACMAGGIPRDRLVVDPGFGFGKTDAHNLLILQRLGEFRSLKLPLLVGLSRKRTLGNLTGRKAKDRVAAGVAGAVLALERGAHIVRTHDVAATADACRVVSATRNAAGNDQVTAGSP